MHHETEAFRELAERVRRGDQLAAVQLARALGPTLEAMARRALRLRTADGPFDERVLAEAETLPDADTPDGRDRAACRAARRVCTSIIDRLRSGMPVRRPLADTVVA